MRELSDLHEDISEQCGYSIAQQIALFNSIKPLFVGKPIIVACNKVDVIKYENMNPNDRYKFLFL